MSPSVDLTECLCQDERVSILKILFTQITKRKKQATHFEKASFVPRAPRVKILALHHVHFKRTSPEEPTPIQLANLSASGLGLIRPLAMSWPQPQSSIQGNLVVGNQEYPLSLKIVWLSETAVGCALENPTPEFLEMVRRYFKSETAALKMTQLRPDLLQQVPEGMPHSFIGENNCELYYVLNENKLPFFYLSFFGNYIEGGIDGKLYFGVVDDNHHNAKPSYKTANLVQTTSPFSADTVGEAIRFVQSIENASPVARELICSLLQKQTRIAP